MSKHHNRAPFWLLAATLLLSGCPAGTTTSMHSEEATAVPADAEATPATPVTPEPPAEPEVVVVARGKAILHTSAGPITVTFFPENAPRTVEHIVALMAAGCYKGVEIFRLEPGFVAQVGNVTNADCHPKAMDAVPDEPTQNVKHARLHLSLARGDEPNSGTSSWSMMLGPGAHLDGQFALFGKIVAGEDTLQKIEAIGSTKGEQGMRFLNEKVTIERVEIVEPVTAPEPDAPESDTPVPAAGN